MKTSIYLAISLFCLGTLLPAQDAPAPVQPWAAADYSRFSPATFRAYPQAGQILDRKNPDYGLLSAAVFFATNEQRALHKRPPLIHSPALHRAAQRHTHDMAVGGFFAHDNPLDPTRRTPWQRMAAEGVADRYCSENIAKTFVTRQTYLSAADTLVRMWMKSPGHRRNLLDPQVRYLGVGVHACRCPQFHLLATQNFASSAPN